MNVVDAWAKLDKALTGLEKAGEGRVARMNHRKKTLAALRALRSAIDEEYPVVRKKIRRRKTPVSEREHITRCHRKGWVEVAWAWDTVNRLVKLRVPHQEITGGILAPKWVAWALEQNLTDSAIKKAVKSRTEQKAWTTLYVATKGDKGHGK